MVSLALLLLVDLFVSLINEATSRLSAASFFDSVRTQKALTYVTKQIARFLFKDISFFVKSSMSHCDEVSQRSPIAIDVLFLCNNNTRIMNRCRHQTNTQIVENTYSTFQAHNS
jgi:hypothetical protein